MSNIIAEKAAKLVKIIRLRNTPGMDEIAIKLNSNPTYDEVLEAEMWQSAFAAVEEKKK